MALKYFQIHYGSVNGTVFDFEKEGDEIPLHSHDVNGNHISIVARGKIKAYGDDWEKIVSAGDVLDWPAIELHGMMAIEDNTRVVNIMRNVGLNVEIPDTVQ